MVTQVGDFEWVNPSMAGADRTDTERVVELAPKAGALRLWSEIVRSLSQAGYEQAGPEYLRLSKLLIETRTAELVNGQDLTDAGWTQLREQAAEALRLLEPLVESARLLATVPLLTLVNLPTIAISEATVRMTCGAWKVPQTVSSPFTLSMDATHWQVSSGDGWVRW